MLAVPITQAREFIDARLEQARHRLLKMGMSRLAKLFLEGLELGRRRRHEKPRLDRPRWHQYHDGLMGASRGFGGVSERGVEFALPSLHPDIVAVDHDDERHALAGTFPHRGASQPCVVLANPRRPCAATGGRDEDLNGTVFESQSRREGEREAFVLLVFCEQPPADSGHAESSASSESVGRSPSSRLNSSRRTRVKPSSLRSNSHVAYAAR